LASALAWAWFSHDLAADTYRHAQAADDADDTAKARALYAEACDEGSDDACRAIGRKR